MKCNQCENEAVVHEVTIKNGVKTEIHLCKEHASESGYQIEQHQTPFSEMITQFAVSQSHGPGTKARKACPECRMTYSRFKRTGTLGCPKCYEVFARELAPLIERAQGGATHHVGKVPHLSDVNLERQLEIRRIAHELDRAVASEQYERAARLRDELLNLDPPRGKTDGASSLGGDLPELES